MSSIGHRPAAHQGWPVRVEELLAVLNAHSSALELYTPYQQDQEERFYFRRVCREVYVSGHWGVVDVYK